MRPGNANPMLNTPEGDYFSAHGGGPPSRPAGAGFKPPQAAKVTDRVHRLPADLPLVALARRHPAQSGPRPSPRSPRHSALSRPGSPAARPEQNFAAVCQYADRLAREYGPCWSKQRPRARALPITQPSRAGRSTTASLSPDVLSFRSSSGHCPHPEDHRGLAVRGG